MRTHQRFLALVISAAGFGTGTVAAFSCADIRNSNSKIIGSGGTSSSSRLNVSPVEAWTAYNDALEASPLLVKSVTASAILGAADLAGQALEAKQKKDAAAVGATTTTKDIDWARTVRFAIFGLVLQAPWNHFYYNVLDGVLPPTEEPWTPTTGIKVVIDQFVQAPIFTVLIFAFLGTLEGKSMEAIKAQLDDDYADTMFANWKLWVPATVVNIAFVPPLFRVLYLNGVFFFWSIFLSLKLNKGESEGDDVSA